MNIAIRFVLTSTALCAALAAPVFAAPEPADAGREISQLAWQQGPATLALGTTASLRLPQQTGALDESQSAKFLRLTGNLPHAGVNIVAAERWWATFEYVDAGHVPDDESIDADALLKQIKDGDAPANERRREQGLPELVTDGWSVAPHYDKTSKRLEWGLKLHSVRDNEPIINYTVRVLGRTGYERAVLVSAPATIERDIGEFKAMLGGFEFKDGQRYSEFRQGDRIAQFGLGALVVGGAAAVATKTGFWKVLAASLAAGWKVVAAVVVGVIAALGKVFKRKT